MAWNCLASNVHVQISLSLQKWRTFKCPKKFKWILSCLVAETKWMDLVPIFLKPKVGHGMTVLLVISMEKAPQPQNQMTSPQCHWRLPYPPLLCFLSPWSPDQTMELPTFITWLTHAVLESSQVPWTSPLDSLEPGIAVRTHRKRALLLSSLSLSLSQSQKQTQATNHFWVKTHQAHLWVTGRMSNDVETAILEWKPKYWLDASWAQALQRGLDAEKGRELTSSWISVLPHGWLRELQAKLIEPDIMISKNHFDSETNHPTSTRKSFLFYLWKSLFGTVKETIISSSTFFVTKQKHLKERRIWSSS